MASASAALGREASSMKALILQTSNPLDLSIEDLAELAERLERDMTTSGHGDVPVKVRGNEPLGAGNQFTDFLILILPNAEFIKETAFTAIIGSSIAFMRRRFKRKHESRRPREIQVYGPDEQLKVVIKLTSEDAEPEWFNSEE
jgi:hypothetical protein